MPIYEFECEEHGIYEVYFGRYTDIDAFECHIDNCSLKCLRIHSLTNIQPDSYWSGKQTQQGVFSSKKEYLNYLKTNNIERVDRSIIEEVQKKKDNKIANFIKEADKRNEKLVSEILAPVQLD